MSDVRGRVARAIHDGLGGNGWAYSDWCGDEMMTKHDELTAAADAALLACGYAEMRKALEDVTALLDACHMDDAAKWEGALMAARSILERTGEKP